jgi:hypothetical protein
MDASTCNICKKHYSSYKSLWNHIKKYHKNDVPNVSTDCKPKVDKLSTGCQPDVNQKSGKIQIDQNDNIDNTFNEKICNLCNTVFTTRQAKSRHIKYRCKKNTNYNEDDNIKQMLFNIIKECKIHPKTLQKINKQLINNNTTNNTNNGIINNNTINIVKFGTEELQSILSQSDMLKILNKKMQSLEESIKTIHFNKDRPELKNIYITNLKDQYAYIYDGTKFIAGLKSDILGELVDNHIENIEYSVEEYKNKLQPKTIDVLDKFLEKINDDETVFTDKEHKKTYPNYKNFKINQIKLMIYNQMDHNTNVVNVICSRE